MVEAAREQLATLQVAGPVRLVALSLGGMVAMDWLRRHPEQVAAAALINSSAAPFSPFWRRLRPRNYGRILCQGLLGRDRLARERMILDITTNHLSPARRDEIARRFLAVDRARPVSAANTVRQLWAAARFRRRRRCPDAAGAGDQRRRRPPGAPGLFPDPGAGLGRPWRCTRTAATICPWTPRPGWPTPCATGGGTIRRRRRADACARATGGAGP